MSDELSLENLPYNPKSLERELQRHYICSSTDEIAAMLKDLSLNSLEELFSHLPSEVLFKKDLAVDEELEYLDTAKYFVEISKKNNPKTCFIGDGLKNYKVSPIVEFVSNIRGLTTAYTPYQPERSQGTLQTLWLYSSALSMLTGFEAINASMYDRATCLYEAIATSLRLVKKASKVIVFGSIYPGDIEVIKTLAEQTKIQLEFIELDANTGTIDISKLEQMIKDIQKENQGELAAIAFPQVNSLGNLEDVNLITDLCYKHSLKAIGIIDPILLATKGLAAPSTWGSQKQGAHMIVGEGQHLAIAPNFGGPGLGIFGIRYNQQDKLSIRQSAGRYVGLAQDIEGRACKAMVLSTREQHIRREKATSNICSNQSFLATLAGAAILERGEKGMADAHLKARKNAVHMARKLTRFKGVNLAFAKTQSYNEFVLEVPINADQLITTAAQNGIHLGVNVTDRIGGDTGARNTILLSFFDIHTPHDLEKLDKFFASQFEDKGGGESLVDLSSSYLRDSDVGLPQFSLQQLKDYYTKLGEQNVSPDSAIYPLGSCTMKYNPYINDFAATLPGFTDIHPQAPLEDAQGCLEILYQTQEWFKAITGLCAVTTQPVAGAQGELVGLKMFQAYFKDKGEQETRNLILIPRSAHGTNPATATMAGFETKKIGAVPRGILTIEANSHGQMDLDQIRQIISEHGPRIAGIMVTNPNTSGIFESEFYEMSQMIHAAGGLVYMDGANMNAIAGWVDLGKMGVDAVHNNLHKTWTIPHGGGGPGDAIVAVSERLKDYLPGIVVEKNTDKNGESFSLVTPHKSIGSFHRHFGNFAHKVRCFTYLKRLGRDGIKNMSAVSVLAARYLYHHLKDVYPTLPTNCEDVTRMHEFILTIPPQAFEKIAAAGTPKVNAIARIGKLFLDFGMHAPTVAFPEIYGLMIEPTETYSKKELDRFIEIVVSIYGLIQETPHVLATVPHFTPIDRVDEVGANKELVFFEPITALEEPLPNRISPHDLAGMDVKSICDKILQSCPQA